MREIIGQKDAKAYTQFAATLGANPLLRNLAGPDRMILKAALDIKQLSSPELEQVISHVAQTLMAEAARVNGAPELVGMFNRLPTSAVEELVGVASDGSPLRELFEAMGERTGRGVREALETAVATGMGPRETARLVRQQFGMGLNRALTIARTEQIRAYREASGRSYEANADVLDGWVWLSAADSRTCVSCLAMHGSVHAVQRRIESHPNCRCVMAPRVKDAPIDVTPGEELFAQMTPAQQRGKLGPAMYEAWLDGRVSLAPEGSRSVVGRRENADWGPMRYARSLQEIIGQRDAKEYVSLALREAKLSPNETDRLVRRLIRSGRAATAQEVEQIAIRVGQAPFNQSFQPAGKVKGLTLQGRTVQPQDTSDWIHLVQRVLKDNQWTSAVTVTEYIADLQHAAQAADKLAIYQRRGGNVVMAIAPTTDVVRPGQLGGAALPYLVVIYSADRGIIVSGYQASDLATITIPTDVTWLRR